MKSEKASVAIVAQRPSPLRAVILNMLGGFLFLAGFSGRALATENVPFEELGGEQCFMFSALFPYRLQGDYYVRPPIELVINNQEEYRKLFVPEVRKQQCDNVDPSNAIPPIDFTRQTVLGLWSSGSCADGGFEKRVSKDDVQKWVIYSVTVVGSDIACSGPGPESLNLIAVPKIAPEYRIFFENVQKGK
jgi:hypothetical protein